MDRRAREAADFLARFDRLDTTRLAPAERVTRALLRRELAEAVEGNRFGQRAVLFTTYYGWHTGFANLPDSHPFREPADYEAYVARLAAFPRYNRGAIETTRAAVAGGFAQPCAPLADYEGAISGVTTGEPERSRFLEPFARRPASIDSAAWIALRGRALAAVRDSVYPAYAELLAFYRKEYAPRCRATASIASTPGGADYYAFRVRAETTTELTPEQVHQLGLREVARIGAEMDSVARGPGTPTAPRSSRGCATTRATTRARRRAALGRRGAGQADRRRAAALLRAAAAAALHRAADPGGAGADHDDRVLRARLARGGAAGHLPGQHDEARPAPALRAAGAHRARGRARPPPADRAAQELDLPPVRRYGVAFAAFTEGWGLYAERLGIEMGLYDTPEKEMGRLSYEMWRATRLVVDPGIHAKGWTREQAIAYMLAAHGAVARQHRGGGQPLHHLARPGDRLQGGRAAHPRAARARRTRLGARFDLRAFHDAVLEHGPVPLDVLEAQVERWIASQESGSASGR
jgi:uncharacterized protein (DUF885 family)